MICGNGSLFTDTWVVVGSTSIVFLTATVPRSKGPAWAGTLATRL